MSMEIVNGYVCRNCSDVELAKKGVDPAKPKEAPQADEARPDRGPAVQLSGALAQGSSPTQQVQPAAYVPGAIADLRA
jgi:hypothetical protein